MYLYVWTKGMIILPSELTFKDIVSMFDIVPMFDIVCHIKQTYTIFLDRVQICYLCGALLFLSITMSTSRYYSLFLKD